MTRISASILGFYFEAKANKQSESVMIETINKAIAEKKDQFDILHLDIEDGKFVNNKSFTPPQAHKIKCNKKREVHLMVVKYDEYIKEFFTVADMFIVHNEVLKSDFEKTINFLHKNKKFVGISISPDTPVDSINYLDKIDLVLVMSVHPGLPGQKFIETSIRKVKKLADLRKKYKHHYTIEVDGGINETYAKKCSEAGADILVIGTHFFR